MTVEFKHAPKQAGEKETLLGFLDQNRAIMVWKLRGLSDDDARRPMVPSGTNLIGLVKHLAWVERGWFDDFFAGNDIDYPFSDDDPDGDLRAEPDDTIDRVVTLYEAHVAISDAIVAANDLDRVSVRSSRRTGEQHSLRWIIGHMVEETARHAGHADIIREMIDGTTGYVP